MPYYLVTVSFGHDANVYHIINIMFWMLCMNSCMNPLIYAMFYQWFRRSAKYILTLKIFEPSSELSRIWLSFTALTMPTHHTIALITQLSPIIHLPRLSRHTCTSFTHPHISNTLPCTHCEVLFLPCRHF